MYASVVVALVGVALVAWLYGRDQRDPYVGTHRAGSPAPEHTSDNLTFARNLVASHVADRVEAEQAARITERVEPAPERNEPDLLARLEELLNITPAPAPEPTLAEVLARLTPAFKVQPVISRTRAMTATERLRAERKRAGLTARGTTYRPQCAATTRTGERCKRPVSTGIHCAGHFNPVTSL